VPEPSWGRVAFAGAYGFFRTFNPVRYLTKRRGNVDRYGGWLRNRLAWGAYQYCPIAPVTEEAPAADWKQVEAFDSFRAARVHIR